MSNKEKLEGLKPSLQLLSENIDRLINHYKNTLPKGVDIELQKLNDMKNINCVKGEYLAFIITANLQELESDEDTSSSHTQP